MQSSLWWICAKFDILHLTQPRNCAKATHVQSHLELVCERLITCLCLSFTSIFSESSRDHKLNWVLYLIFILPRQWVVCCEVPSTIPQRRKAVSNRLQSEALVSTKRVETGWPRKISSKGWHLQIHAQRCPNLHCGNKAQKLSDEKFDWGESHKVTLKIVPLQRWLVWPLPKCETLEEESKGMRVNQQSPSLFWPCRRRSPNPDTRKWSRGENGIRQRVWLMPNWVNVAMQKLSLKITCWWKGSPPEIWERAAKIARVQPPAWNKRE